MDELVIGDKKYVSSKQAAKLTGYAKDYVGQLCREGRVPARLVGRSWYVLESAIQDHRFGKSTEESVPAKVPPAAKTEKQHITDTWTPPHYEAMPVHQLPTLNVLEQEKTESPIEAAQDAPSEPIQENSEEIQEGGQPHPHEALHETWHSLFNNQSTETTISQPSEEAEQRPVQQEQEEEEKIEVEKEPEPAKAEIPAIRGASYAKPERESVPMTDIDIPIHIRSNPLPSRDSGMRNTTPRRSRISEEDGIPTRMIGESRTRSPNRLNRWRGGFRSARTIRATSIVIAVLMIYLVAVNTGFFDKYVISYARGVIFSGVSVINK